MTSSNTSAASSTGRVVASVLAVLAVIVAAVCAVWFGYRGYQAYFVDKPIQSTRDGAVAGAEQAIINVTTVDPKNTADWKRRVDASLTGKAKDQISQQDVTNLNSMITEAGPQAASLTSRLVRSAPTEVNADDEKAKVLVFVAATSKRENEAGVTRTMGFSVSMTKVGDDWKAEDIAPLDAMSFDQSVAESSTAPSAGGGN
ncbi:hypothetical protein AAFP30_16465 [Gordonia sp. CPCC 205515]|uniref:hypothetical protein n=1 Tax=Gordonia sp. CPCC 205515 TaxID=3140791 RepID=UPI003AF3C164